MRILVLGLAALGCLLGAVAPTRGATLCDTVQMEVLQDDAQAFVAAFTASPSVRWGMNLTIGVPDSVQVVPEILESVFVPDRERTTTDFLPTGPIRCDPPRLFRGLWLQDCVVTPVWADGGAPVKLQRVVIRFSFGASRPAARAALARALAPFERALYRGAMDNPGALEAFLQLPMARAAGAGVAIEDLFARRDQWLRVEITQGGIHRLRHSDLVARLGDTVVDAIDPATFRLFGAPDLLQPVLPEDPAGSWTEGYTLVERAIHLRTAGSMFAPGDEILFYTGGPEDWADRHDPSRPPLEHVEHEFSDRIALWLTWDDPTAPGPAFPAPPRRMVVVDGNPGGGSPLVRSHRARLNLEQNRLLAYGVFEDNWAWEQGLRPGQPLEFALQLDATVPDSAAWFAHQPLARKPRSGGNNIGGIGLSWDGVALADTTFDLDDQHVLGSDPPRVGVAVPAPVAAGSHRIGLENQSPANSAGLQPELYVDGFSLLWRRPLQLRDGRLQWLVFPDEAPGAGVRFELSSPAGGLGPGGAWLDTTDPHQPRWISNSTVGGGGTTQSAEYFVPAGSPRHYAAAAASGLLSPAALELHRPRLLRQEVADAGAGYDMVLLAPAGLLPAATQLADVHATNGLEGHPSPRVAVVDLQDVYDQFGHGVKEPAAVRNYLKFLYESDPRLEFVLLMGDASRDYRNRLGRDPSGPEFDRCPTYIQTKWPLDPFRITNAPYAADDWLGAFDDPRLPIPGGLDIFIDLPDLALGRLPVGSLAEAQAYVGRIRDYLLDPVGGDWRNKLLLVADDEVAFANGGNQRETDHIDEAECIAGWLLPPELDTDKLYLTEFPAAQGARAKPAARQALRSRWSDGALLVHYIGHGSPEQMADESVFRIEDVGTLTNAARLPLFLAFSCDVAIFDSPFSKSLSEQLVLANAGGAIASIAATQITFISSNEELTEAFYPRLYDPELPLDRSTPVGRALMLAKVNVPRSAQAGQQHNDQKFVLLGDPALRLQSPRSMVAFQDSLADGLTGGRVLQLGARVEDQGVLRPGAAGRYWLEARESADSVLYIMDEGPAPPGRLSYTLDGNAFFEGQGSYAGGQLDVEFPVPATLREGQGGRVRLLLEDGSDLYVGLLEPLAVQRGAIDGSDTAGPQVQLAFAGGARTVAPGATVVATLSDSSGINTLGSTPASSILLEIDDSGIRSDVTEFFQLDDGSYSTGRLETVLPTDIEPGPHSITLSAGDMLGNVSLARIDFTVAEAGGIAIARHVPVPNPFGGETRFVVEINAPTGTASAVSLDIHSLDGRTLRTLRGNLDGGGTLVLPWDGTDRAGGQLANGVYLYTVRASFQPAGGGDAPAIREVETGRVVRMR